MGRLTQRSRVDLRKAAVLLSIFLTLVAVVAGVSIAVDLWPHAAVTTSGEVAPQGTDAPVARRSVNAHSRPPLTPPPKLRVRSLTVLERQHLVAEGVKRARDFCERGNLVRAMSEYTNVLGMEPDNRDAIQGLAECKRFAEIVKPVRAAFETLDYHRALSLLYRAPETIHEAGIDRLKVNGWYNYALISLRAGDCDEAIRRLEEARSLDATDEGIQWLLRLAQDCRQLEGPERRLPEAELLSFRAFDSPGKPQLASGVQPADGPAEPFEP